MRWRTSHVLLNQMKGYRVLWLLLLFASLPQAIYGSFDCKIEKDHTMVDLLKKCSDSQDFFTVDGVTLDLSKETEEDVKKLFGGGIPKLIVRTDLRLVNSSIETLDIKGIRMISGSKSYEIRGNKNLTNIELSNAFSIELVKYFGVSGNPKLKKEVLDRLRALLSSKKTPVAHYIQEEGECILDGPVTDASQLKDCKYILGDLILNSYYNKTVPTLSKITGCLIIKNTQLDNIKFLKLTDKGSQICGDGKESEISGNPNLWLHPRDQNELRDVFGNITIVMDPNAGSPCNPKQALDANYACITVFGDLVITCSPQESLKSLESIKIVKGIIHVNGSSCKELIFPEITEIGESTDPALVVTNNPNLERIELPKIADFLSHGVIAIRFSGNPKFVLGDGQYEQWKSVSNNKKIEFECNPFGNPISDLASISHCTSVNGDLALKGTTGSTSTKIEYISGCLRIVDTKLSDLSFLTLNVNVTSTCTGKSQISGNKNFCLSMDEYQVLETRLGSPIDYIPDESCDRTCNESDFLHPSSFCENLEGDLLISGLTPGSPMLELMKKVKVINGKLTISGNIGVDIEFPELLLVNNSESNEVAIEVSGNTDPKTLSMPKLESVITNGTIAISLKDYHISREQAEVLAKASNGSGFMLECNFGSTPISKLSDVDYCTSVKGDLLLHNTEGVTSSHLSGISGCLQIIGTKLTNLDFLENLDTSSTSDKCLSITGTSEVKENKNLCLSGDQIIRIQRAFGQKISWNMEEKCDISCSFEEQLEVNVCTVLKGRVGITEYSDESKVKKALQKVRTINGYIQIDNTKISSLDFTQLETINTSAGVALSIADNNALKDLTFPKLKSLTVKGSRAVAITRNEGFRLSEDLKNLLEKLVGDKEMVYECHESSPISDFTQIKGCSILSSDLKLFGDVTGTPQKLILVAGCLQIENTTLESVDFLDLKGTSGLACNNESYITGNMNLTLSPEKSKELTSKIVNLTISDNKPEESSTPSTSTIPPTTATPTEVTSTSGGSISTGSVPGAGSTGTSPTTTGSTSSNPTVPPSSSTESTVSTKTSSTGSTPTASSPTKSGPTCIATDGKVSKTDCKIVEGDLKVEKECTSVASFSQIEEIRGHLTVKDCSLGSIRSLFPKLKKITASSGVLMSLEGIEGELKLKEFKEIDFNSNEEDEVVLKIETKKEIPFLEAADFQMEFGRKRVELVNVEKTPEGVCLFLDPAAEVKDCSKIEGDLILDENTNKINTNLTEITGCLIVKNTNLENYDFLTTIENVGEKCRWSDKTTEITDNSCIPYKVRKAAKGKIAEEVGKGENKKECHECEGDKFVEQKCEVVIGDLVVTGAPDDTFLARLEKVKEIYGSFVAKNSTATSIRMKKLTIVDNGDSKVPAIEIVGNRNLTSLTFPSLTFAASKGKNLIKITENGKLDESEALLSQLKQVAGQDCKDDAESLCYFSNPKSSSKSSSKGKKALPSKGEKGQEQDEEVLSPTMIALIIGGVLVLITIAIILILVAMVMRKKRKEKNSKEGGKEKKKKKGKKSSEIVDRENPSPMETPKNSKEPLEKPSKTKTGSKEPAVDPLAETVIDGQQPAV